MNLKELTDLINIRQYVINSTSNPTIDRATVNAMNGTLILIDKKIIAILTGQEFRDYIGYADVKKAIEEVANANNIKSGLRRNPHTGQLEKI